MNLFCPFDLYCLFYRCPEDRVDGTNVKSGHQKGRIADKISLFERETFLTIKY